MRYLELEYSDRVHYLIRSNQHKLPTNKLLSKIGLSMTPHPVVSTRVAFRVEDEKKWLLAQIKNPELIPL